MRDFAEHDALIRRHEVGRHATIETPLGRRRARHAGSPSGAGRSCAGVRRPRHRGLDAVLSERFQASLRRGPPTVDRPVEAVAWSDRAAADGAPRPRAMHGDTPA